MVCAVAFLGQPHPAAALAEPMAGGLLRIGIEHGGIVARFRQRGSQQNGQRGLATAAALAVALG